MQKNAFYLHLKEAIHINQQRKPLYLQQTQGKSAAVSRLLIMSEKMSLPIAHYFDWRARKLNQQGIAIVAEDFVPMDDILPPDTSPLYPQCAAPTHIKAAQQLVKSFNRQVKTVLNSYDFGAACATIEDALQQIEQIEHNAQAHFAMLKHLLESIGFAAVNAIEYAHASQGASRRLSRQLVKIQLTGLPIAIKVDAQAQKIHQLGVGIVVNDVPPIPFLERWKQKF